MSEHPQSAGGQQSARTIADAMSTAHHMANKTPAVLRFAAYLPTGFIYFSVFDWNTLKIVANLDRAQYPLMSPQYFARAVIIEFLHGKKSFGGSRIFIAAASHRAKYQRAAAV